MSTNSSERIPSPNWAGSVSRPESYVDAKEGAEFLRIHAKTLMRLAREGQVPAYSFSEGTRRHWRFLLSELDKWIKTKGNSSAAPVRSRHDKSRTHKKRIELGDVGESGAAGLFNERGLRVCAPLCPSAENTISSKCRAIAASRCELKPVLPP